jgi:hypothetical protein
LDLWLHPGADPHFQRFVEMKCFSSRRFRVVGHERIGF